MFSLPSLFTCFHGWSTGRLSPQSDANPLSSRAKQARGWNRRRLKGNGVVAGVSVVQLGVGARGGRGSQGIQHPGATPSSLRASYALSGTVLAYL
eukprot:2983032-Rhodomonas_salina.1